jgi:hypothetical protein
LSRKDPKISNEKDDLQTPPGEESILISPSEKDKAKAGVSSVRRSQEEVEDSLSEKVEGGEKVLQAFTEVQPPTPSGEKWSCLWKERGDNIDLSIGERALLKCSGDLETLSKENLNFLSKENNQKTFLLRVLKVADQKEGEIILEVVSYQAGEHSSQALVLSDGKGSVEAEGVSWRTEGVVNMSQVPAPTPYPAWGPQEISLPFWYWGSMFGFGLLIILLSLHMIRRHTRRNRLFKEVEKLKTAWPAFKEFHKELRTLERERRILGGEFDDYGERLEQTFRLYLARELGVPTIGNSPRTLLREVRRGDKHLFKKCEGDIKKALREVRVLKRRQKEGFQERDCDQVINTLRKSVERVWRCQRERVKG